MDKKQLKKVYNQRYKMTCLMRRIELKERNAPKRDIPEPPPKVHHKKMAPQGWEDALPDPRRGIRIGV